MLFLALALLSVLQGLSLLLLLHACTILAQSAFNARLHHWMLRGCKAAGGWLQVLN